MIPVQGLHIINSEGEMRRVRPYKLVFGKKIDEQLIEDLLILNQDRGKFDLIAFDSFVESAELFLQLGLDVEHAN